MKKFLLSFFLLSAFLFWFTSAHQPRITRDKIWPFVVNTPEVSQAFYGELRGQEDVYTIMSDTWFLLYMSIVVPAISWAKEDFVVTIVQWDSLLARLDGGQHERTNFYEPFAGDAYYNWPEFEQKVSPGTYTIRVENPSYQGKYSLAIGKIESFPGSEIINTFKLLPSLKTYFFGKPVLAMFWNYIGAALAVILIILSLLVLIIRLIVNKKRRRML